MRPRFPFLVALIMVVLPLSLCAENVTTGSYLLRTCNRAVQSADASFHGPQDYLTSFENGTCFGYIDAVIDTYTWYQTNHTISNEFAFCLPQENTFGQLVRVVAKFLNDHPEQLHKPKAVLIMMALHEAFPCE